MAECLFLEKLSTFAVNVGMSRLYGYTLHQRMDTDSDNIEGVAWVVRAKNRRDQVAANLAQKIFLVLAQKKLRL